MSKQKFHPKFLLAAGLINLLLLISAEAQVSTVKTTQTIRLGDSEVRVNVYEQKGSRVTFVAPHHNEQTGLKIAKELIALKGGRLVEIESFDENGNPARLVKFSHQGKSLSLDPNRVFTENGRQCAGLSAEVDLLVKKFAEDFLKIILAPNGGNKLRNGEQFLVAVHNNRDADDSAPSARAKDLTAYAFIKYTAGSQLAHGAFQEQAAGVYVSSAENDEDNFVFLSTPALVGFFVEKGFNVVVQKSAAELQSKKCGVDDGSLSVFSGQQNIPYINLEADAKNGGFRQRQMLEAVYELAQKTVKSELERPSAAVAQGNEKEAGKK